MSSSFVACNYLNVCMSPPPRNSPRHLPTGTATYPALFQVTWCQIARVVKPVECPFSMSRSFSQEERVAQDVQAAEEGPSDVQ